MVPETKAAVVKTVISFALLSVTAQSVAAQQSAGTGPSGTSYDVPFTQKSPRYTDVAPIVVPSTGSVIKPAGVLKGPAGTIVLPSSAVATPAGTVVAPVVPGTVTTSKTTVQNTVSTPAGTQSTTTVIETQTPELKPAVRLTSPKTVTVKYKRPHTRSDWRTAKRMANNHWLDKAAEADPSIVEAICSHYRAARVLARHPRLGAVAEWDHYTCRRLMKWKTVARLMAKNGECHRVVALDPEGLYRALKRDKRLAKILSTNPMFNQMIVDNPDLGRMMSTLM